MSREELISLEELADVLRERATTGERATNEVAIVEGGVPSVTPWRWPARTKDWAQVVLIVAAVAAVVVVVKVVTAPPGPTKITPAGEQVATAFVGALLVHHDCRAAARVFDYVPTQSTQAPEPGTQPDPSTQGPAPGTNRLCAKPAWVSERLGRRLYGWQLVRGSGAVVPNCAFRGPLAARYGVPAGQHDAHHDDCVSFRLIARKPWGFFGGHLDVNARREHGVWSVIDFAAYLSEGAKGRDRTGCRPRCLELWRKRVRVASPG